MMKNEGISASFVACINDILAHYSEVEEALVFGSRAKGTHRPGSDLDLAIKGPHISPMTLARIQADLDESNLPFRVDPVWVNANLSTDLADHIDRVGHPIYKSSKRERAEPSKSD